MRILTHPENLLANFNHQITNKKLQIKRCEEIRSRLRMFLRMKCENFVLAAEIPCEWKFATKFASECECDGLVHSAPGFGAVFLLFRLLRTLKIAEISRKSSKRALSFVAPSSGMQQALVQKRSEFHSYGTEKLHITYRYRAKGVLVKGVGNNRNASRMGQKCVKTAQNESFFWNGGKSSGGKINVRK